MDERRDDWRNGVDQAIVGLTAAQRVTDDQLDDLELKYEALDHVMRGDPEKETDGFISRLHAVETWVQDQKIERVKSKVIDTATEGIKWQVKGSIAVAIIGALAGIIPNCGRIKESFNPIPVQYRPDAKLKHEIDLDKKRHRKKKALQVATFPSIQDSTTTQK